MKSRPWIPPTFASLLFALLSLAVLPYPGIQDDEVLFTVPIYLRGGAFYSAKLFGKIIPLMLMGYLGTLKTWVYAAILEFATPSIWTARVPMVLCGMVTIWLTWEWTRRIAGTRAAAFTVALLSTDAIFILTNTFDWGPVAFQHVLLMSGLLAIQIWLQREDGKQKWLALAFFLWGLGLWDKALMIWPLIGLSVAAAIVYPRQLLRHLRRAPIAIALISLLLGALPLVRYNIARRGETLSSNAKFSLSQLPHKTEELRETLDGSVLLDTMVSTTPGPIEQTPKTTLECLSVAAKRLLGEHPVRLMLPAIAMALACLIFLFWAQAWRIPVFILIVSAVTWFQMASNTGTGGGAHHVVLLWPFPCIFVGVTFAAVADRVPRLLSLSVAGLIVLIAGANLLNTNEYLANLILNGGIGGWTDASRRLAGAIYPYRAGHIGIVDWGYLNPLRMMYGGDLKLTVVSDVPTVIADPDFIFIQHTNDKQMFHGVNEQLSNAALTLGYTEQVSRVVHDDEGRPVFEIFRFVKSP